MSAAIVDLALVAAAMPVVVASAYLLVLALLSRRAPLPSYDAPHLRFAVVVPAHDEEEGITETVASLNAIDYPPSLRRVIVVADNCSDDTAGRARAAGAQVLVRDDPELRGKGYALARAFEYLLSDGTVDAVVVVDADTIVSRNLLGAFAARLDAGAVAIQASYRVRNPADSWRTTLMAVAFALFIDLRSRARERLRCSSGLHGNGMCFALRLLRDVPHDAFSVVEDLEYGIQLGLAGHRVHYAAEAEVAGEMVSSAKSSRSQRQRWEQGRWRMVRQYAMPLLRRWTMTGDRVILALALELLVPPLASLGAAAVAGTLLASAASWHAERPMAAAWLWGSCVAAQSIYVMRGWWLSGTGVRGLIGLAHAPAYLLWKISLLSSRRVAAPDGWERTNRERRSG